MVCNYNGCSSKCKGDIDVESCNVLRAYQKGARDFVEWLLVNHTLYCIECNSGDKSIGCKECANEYLAEWQKGKKKKKK